MKNLKLIGVLLLLCNCNNQISISDLTGEWYEIKFENNKYQFIDCGYDGEYFIIKNDSIYDHGVMEDFISEIIKKESIKDTIYLYVDERNYYKLFLINKEREIIKRESSFGNISRFYISGKNLHTIEKIKGTSNDCVSSDADDVSLINEDYIGRFQTRKIERDYFFKNEIGIVASNHTVKFEVKIRKDNSINITKNIVSIKDSVKPPYPGFNVKGAISNVFNNDSIYILVNEIKSNDMIIRPVDVGLDTEPAFIILNRNDSLFLKTEYVYLSHKVPHNFKISTEEYYLQKDKENISTKEN